MNIPQIKKFVGHYSMCSSVHEIKIIVPQSHLEKYQNIHFIYEHTHSLVNSVDATAEESINWETESLMLLDPHVFVSCDDLKFSLSVWQSSYDSLVGYFPRSHTSSNDRLASLLCATFTLLAIDPPFPYSLLLLSSDSQKRTVSFQYLDWRFVLWHHRYSLMLPSAVILKKEIWEVS
jgi:hypothetical protein